MGLQKAKNKISERGEIHNHVFQGLDTVKGIFKRVLRSEDWLVYFDPDVDGVIAGYLACKFLAKRGRKFSWYINSNREHGWMLPVEKVAGKNIIAVDFIITSQQIQELCSSGCNVINLDHHKNGDSLISVGNKGIVVNNQYPFEDSDGRYLSGAGVVFETLIQLDPSFDDLLNRQLVAITLLSDIRDIENPCAEGYLYKLYSGKYTGFLKYLIDSTMGDKDYGFGVPRMDRNYVDFKFSPAINACFRFNKQDEVVMFFLGQGQLDLGWRKSQQELIEKLKDKVKMAELEHLRVCYFYESDIIGYSDVLSSFVGLLASQKLDEQHSVVCYMIAVNSKGRAYVKRASFRGRINGLDYNAAFVSGVALDCRGHGSAFGIKKLVPQKKLFVELDRLCAELEDNSGYVKPIIEVVNLSLFVGRNAYNIAEDNLYRLSQNQTVVKYVGNNIKVKRQGGSYIEYDVDGIPVMCFDLKLNFSTSYISPVLERGTLTFYLE